MVSCSRAASPVAQAALLSSKGQDTEAVALLEGYLARHPSIKDSLPERRLLIRLHAAAGDLGASQRAAAELAALLPPTSPTPWIELGHALELAHRYDEALEQYDRAAGVAPADPAGPRTGGMRAARWGESELAAPRLEEALRRNPRDAAGWHALGLVRLHLGDLDGARVAYESGLLADPTALENRVGLATLALRAGDAPGALAQYDRILAARPDYREGYLGRAWALTLSRRYAEAAAALDEAQRRGADVSAIGRQRTLIEARRREAAQK